MLYAKVYKTPVIIFFSVFRLVLLREWNVSSKNWCEWPIKRSLLDTSETELAAVGREFLSKNPINN